MYQLEIDYEMVAKTDAFDEAEKWAEIALKAGALRVAIWQSDQRGENQRVVESSGFKLQKLILPNMS